MCRAYLPALLAFGACSGSTAEKPSDDTADSGMSPDSAGDTGEDPTVDTDTGGGDTDTDTGVERELVELSLLLDADVKLIGETARSKWRNDLSVSSAGDIDADGFDDVIVGSKWVERGRAYVVSGGSITSGSLGDSDAVIAGPTDEACLGSGVSTAGDVNGDGFADLLIGDPCFGSEGRAFLINGPMAGDLEVTSLATATFIGSFVPNDYYRSSYTGESVGYAGDVDGDGYDDILIGSPGYAATGTAYLVSGPVSGEVDLEVEATMRFRNTGQGGVKGAGDTDGDGFADLMFGANGGSECVHMITGPVAGELDRDDVDSTFLCDDDEEAGEHPAAVGDFDGDGYEDVLVGARASGRGAPLGGAAYLLRGPFGSTVDVSGSDTVFFSTVANERAGYAVAGAGDVDGDGFADLLIGSSDVTDIDDGPGTTYLIRGPVRGYFSLDESDVIIHGEGGDDASGKVVAGAGDVDGDGLADILIGGPGDDDGGEEAGAVWLVLGGSIW